MGAMTRRSIARAALLAALAIAPATVTAQGRGGAFAGLSGSWSGNGQVKFDGGQTEAVKCVAYYKDRDGGAGVGLAVRCSSASGGGIELRANLAAAGSAVTGTWEERKYNAGGNLTGQSEGNRISLVIDGGGLSGTMTVTTNGGKQALAFVSQGSVLQGVNIALSRD